MLASTVFIRAILLKKQNSGLLENNTDENSEGEPNSKYPTHELKTMSLKTQKTLPSGELLGQTAGYLWPCDYKHLLSHYTSDRFLTQSMYYYGFKYPTCELECKISETICAILTNLGRKFCQVTDCMTDFA